MRLTILHADANALVIDKPAGLAVHPGPRTPHSLEDLLPSLVQGTRHVPAPVHRLDRDTSGCLCLARTRAAHRALSAAFAARQVRKTYLALLRGEVPGESGVIDSPLAKISSAAQGWRMIRSATGQPARTRWNVLRRTPGTTLVRFEPETGRTHQLRVHATIIAAGIVGDPIYGDAAPDEPAATLLHAWRLAVPMINGAPAFLAEAPPPALLDPLSSSGEAA